MKKEFKSWREVLDFSYVDFSMSQYFSFTGERLPRLRDEYSLEKWRICQASGLKKGVYMEVTPLWISLTIINEKDQPARKQDFKRNGLSVRDVLQKVFE